MSSWEQPPGWEDDVDPADDGWNIAITYDARPGTYYVRIQTLSDTPPHQTTGDYTVYAVISES